MIISFSLVLYTCIVQPFNGLLYAYYYNMNYYDRYLHNWYAFDVETYYSIRYPFGRYSLINSNHLMNYTPVSLEDNLNKLAFLGFDT